MKSMLAFRIQPSEAAIRFLDVLAENRMLDAWLQRADYGTRETAEDHRSAQIRQMHWAICEFEDKDIDFAERFVSALAIAIREGQLDDAIYGF